MFAWSPKIWERVRWSLLLAATLLAFLATERRALAADAAAEAEQQIRQGLKLRHENKDELALPYFQKAYELVRTPRTEGQLGLVEMALGYWMDAEQHLEEVLKAADHPWVVKNQSALRGALAQVKQNIGDVVVEDAPAGAEIIVNGRSVGSAPLAKPIRVSKGVIEVEVRATGYRSSTSRVRIAGGDQQKVTGALEKIAPATGGETAVATSAAPPPAVAPPPATREGEAGTDHKDIGSHPGRVRRKLAWGAAIAGALAIGGAVAETVVWQKKRSDFESLKGPPPGDPNLDPAMWKQACGAMEPGRGGPGCQTLYDAGRRAQTLAIVGYAVGGALAVTSVVLFATGRPERESSETHAAACGPQLFPHGMGCAFTF